MGILKKLDNKCSQRCKGEKEPLFAGKWMELEIIILSEIRLRNTNILCSLSYAESRPKKIEHECKMG
jgi:hypothetical protein